MSAWDRKQRLMDMRVTWAHRILVRRLLQALPNATQEERKRVWETAWEWATAAAAVNGACPGNIAERADWLRAWTPPGLGDL